MDNHNQIDDIKDLDNLLKEKIKDSPDYADFRRREDKRKSRKKAKDDLVIFRSLLEELNIIDRLDNIVNWMSDNLSDMYDSKAKLGLFSNFSDIGAGVLDFPIFYYTIKKSSFFRFKECIWITGFLRRGYTHLDSSSEVVYWVKLDFRNKRLMNQSDGYYQDNLREEEFFTELKKYIVAL